MDAVRHERYGFYSDVGAAITEIRRSAKLTRMQLATVIGVSEACLLEWERGRVDPCGRAVAMLTRLAPDRGEKLLTALAKPARSPFLDMAMAGRAVATVTPAEPRSVPILPTE